jgi:hypothetical protein
MHTLWYYLSYSYIDSSFSVRFKAVIVVNIKITVFWNVMLCSLINRYQPLYPEEGESRFLQSVDIYISQYTSQNDLILKVVLSVS